MWDPLNTYIVRITLNESIFNRDSFFVVPQDKPHLEQFGPIQKKSKVLGFYPFRAGN